jgi:hypothetical protein
LVVNQFYGLVTSDGRSLFMVDNKRQFTFPIDQIRSIKVVVVKRRSWRICPERPPSSFSRIAPSAALEIELASGRMRLFRRWEIENLQWAERALNAYLRLSEVPIDSKGESPVVDTTRFLGKQWKVPAFMLLAVGLLVAGLCGRSIYWGTASWHWPSVAGQVIESKYQEGENNTVVQIRYTYNVGGRRLENDDVRYGGAPGDSDVRDMVKSHAAGSSVVVYYDPTNVERSVLIQGEEMSDWIFLGAGLLALFGAAYLWWKRPTRNQIALAQRVEMGQRRMTQAKGGDDEVVRRLFK